MEGDAVMLNHHQDSSAMFLSVQSEKSLQLKSSPTTKWLSQLVSSSFPALESCYQFCQASPLSILLVRHLPPTLVAHLGAEDKEPWRTCIEKLIQNCGNAHGS